MDGALEQMSTFADVAAKTSADEEMYGSSLTGQQGAHFPPRAAGKAPLPPKQVLRLAGPCMRAWQLHTTGPLITSSTPLHVWWRNSRARAQRVLASSS